MSRELSATSSPKAGRPWESLVGYTAEDLRTHLESLFLPGMTWENRKLWHVDHVVPLFLWDYDGPEHPEFRAAWSLANLRPVWAKENLVKNKRLPTLEDLQRLWGLK